MSQPAVEVTGSQEVGSSHSQFSVPLAPAVAAEPEAVEVLALLPQAAASRARARPAARATPRRAARGRSDIDVLLSGVEGTGTSS